MIMRKFRYLLALLALVSSSAAFAQWNPDLPPTRDNINQVDKGDDIQGRLRATIEIPVFKNFSVEVSEQVRLKDTFGQVDKFVTSVGVGYKPWKFLKFGADYSFVNERTSDTEEIEDDLGNILTKEIKGWHNQHRFNVDVTGSVRFGDVKISLRERVRFNFRTDDVIKHEHADPFISLRSRLKFAYDLRNSRWEPYVFGEVYNTLNALRPVENYKNPNNVSWKDSGSKYDNYINRIRVAAGTEFKINNYTRSDFYYMCHFNTSYEARYKNNKGDLKDWRKEKGIAHVIGIDYKFKL